ncbi:unnamed protein product [Alopecurus aequalis]
MAWRRSSDILERRLLAILDIIQDAEEKGAHRPGVSAWLKALKKVANEANDLFNELKYEALRREAKARGHHVKLRLDTVSLLVPAHNPIVFRYRMGKKLSRIVHSIEVLVTEMNSFGFRNQQEAPPSKEWRITDSIIPDSEKDIVSRSRSEEKKQIKNILINNASNRDLTVLPIIGMGGLGKTTFAQLVYNDPEIKEYFQLQRWCCVSDDFDVAKIGSSICQTSENNREKALQNLQTEVSGKRYLIVLDDVWNEDVDKWEKLKTCLKHGGKGSAILMTTRKANVAKIMKTCVDDSHNLGQLHKLFLKEIFENRAFCLRKPNAPELSDVVEKILDRCVGSPLAAKAFGSMLSNKTSMKDWKNILNRSNNSSDKTGILPILKLSYDDLPSHMKLCFAFCAIFPKDHRIDVEFLIQMWMAHDCIELKDGDDLETAGRETFDELTRRSFFQDVKRRPSTERWQLDFVTECSIHDLMHDIALSVMGEDCFSIVSLADEKKLLSGRPTRHLFSPYSFGNQKHLEEYLKEHSQSLQSLLCSSIDGNYFTQHLSKYHHLRALQLKGFRIFSLRPRQLQYLRYLDLSRNYHIEELPKDISILYNLQTLNLSNCSSLVRLPKDMKYMKSLHYLYTAGCISLKGMPPDLGQLTSLKTLTYFVVGSTPDCSTIRELRDLNLGGELKLSCLQHVTEEDAKSSGIGSKENLVSLSLEWSDDTIGEQDQQKCVLDALKPPAVLEFLRIRSYKGTDFPSWFTYLTMLQHLRELHLDGCTMCDDFPQFGLFKALEVLVLKRLDKLQSLCNHSSSAAFQVLKKLKLVKLEIFQRWVATEGEELRFPLLENVEIKHCPLLTTLPEAPKLKVIRLKEEKAQLSLTIFRSRYMSCLRELFLSVSDTEATPAPKLDEDREVSLSVIKLDGCNFLFPSSPPRPAAGVRKWFGQLVSLRINSCDTLMYWPEEEFPSLVSLENLHIRSCSKLIGRTKVKEFPTRGKDQLLPNLKILVIGGCKSLTELFVLPPSLTMILILNCDSLESMLGQDDRALDSQQQFDIAASSENCNDLSSASMPGSSSPSRINALPCLDYLHICDCKKLRFVPAQLDALRNLTITHCCLLESLASLGDLPLLEVLELRNSRQLVSVPGSPVNYSKLEQVTIKYCPAMNMEPLHAHLRQRSNRLLHEDISSAGSSHPDEGPKLWEPKSWKYAFHKSHRKLCTMT